MSVGRESAHSVDRGNGWEMSAHLSVPSTYLSLRCHPSSSSAFFFFFAFPWGFLVAAGAVQMKSVYCSSELTVCIFLILPYLYLLFVSRTSHIIILEAMGKLVVTLFCCVVFLSTAGKKSNCSGSSVSL